MNNIIDIFQDIVSFTKKPTYNPINELSIKSRIFTCSLITILCYLCFVLLPLPLIFLLKSTRLELYTYDLYQVMKYAKESGQINDLYIIFIIFFSAIYNYYILLLPLQKFKRNNVIISFSLISSSLISIIFSYFLEGDSLLYYNLVSSYFVIIGLFILIYYISNIFFCKQFDKLEKYWDNLFNYVFYSYITILTIEFILKGLALGNNIFYIIALSISYASVIIIYAYSSIRIGKIESLIIMLTLYIISMAKLL
jgi:hypothetical protein